MFYLPYFIYLLQRVKRLAYCFSFRFWYIILGSICIVFVVLLTTYFLTLFQVFIFSLFWNLSIRNVRLVLGIHENLSVYINLHRLNVLSTTAHSITFSHRPFFSQIISISYFWFWVTVTLNMDFSFLWFCCILNSVAQGM